MIFNDGTMVLTDFPKGLQWLSLVFNGLACIFEHCLAQVLHCFLGLSGSAMVLMAFSMPLQWHSLLFQLLCNVFHSFMNALTLVLWCLHGLAMDFIDFPCFCNGFHCSRLFHWFALISHGLTMLFMEPAESLCVLSKKIPESLEIAGNS